MATRYDGTAEEVRALNALITLTRASESVTESTGAEIAKAGLTETQFGVLESLLHLGPMCAAELATKVLRSRGNLTLVLSNLERGGLINRTARAEDRRYLTVELTPKGRRLIEGLFPRHVRRVVKTFSALDAREQELLRGLCRKLGLAAAARD